MILMKVCWSNVYSHVSHHFADSYIDRHQTSQYPVYYSEQQDQCRESSYWTLPGSRAVGSLPTYANWTDQNPAGHSSSHFPFILDTQPQHQHQHHVGQYQPHEGRDREWTAAQRASREYDRGFLREGWQRRWESCSPSRYNNREAPSKRNDNSYRELEAWAARYSHSLPRRRRIEAELRGASQGLVDSSRAMERDYRSGTDPRLVALQQVMHSNVKAAGLWTKAGRPQGSIHHPPQSPAADTGHMLNLKDQSISQRKVFSQPPEYVAPPPYSSPQKSLQMLQLDISEKDNGQQNYGPHNAAKGRDAPESSGREEKENLIKSDGNEHNFPKTEGPKQLTKETESIPERSSVGVQESNLQFEGMLSLQLPQLLYSTSSQSNEPSPKVIEGRKFRLNKKKGGLTIFCLVSRIADTSDNLDSSTHSQTLRSTKHSSTVQSSGLDETHKLADEVDFVAPALREKSAASTGKNPLSLEETQEECLLGDLPEDHSPNTADTSLVPKEQDNEADWTTERQVTQSEQSSSVKYPLWKEPSFLVRSEAETLSTGPAEEKEEGETDLLKEEGETDSTEAAFNDTKGETLEIAEVSELEDCKCSPVVDTNCVVVKMEIISSPRKEHVHYFDSTAQPGHSPPQVQTIDSAEEVQSSSQSNRDQTEAAENEAAYSTEVPESELTLDPKQNQTLEDQNGTSSSSAPEKESLEGRAQRILGIPVDDCFTEQHSDRNRMSPVKDQMEEPPQVQKIISGDTEKQMITEATVEEESQVELDDAQTEDAVDSVESEHSPKEAEDESSEVLARHEEQPSILQEQNNDLQCDLSIHSLAEPSVDPETERSSPPLQNKAMAEQLSEGPSSSTKSSSLLLPSPETECLPGDISPFKLSLEKGPDPEPAESPSLQLPLPPPPPATVQSDLQDLSTSARTSPSPEEPSPIQFHLDLINEITETLKEQEDKGQRTDMRNKETSDAHICFAKDETEEAASLQHVVNGCCMEEIYVAPEERVKGSDDSQEEQIREEILEMSQNNITEVLYPQHECVSEQQCFSVEEREVEETSAEQMKASPTGLPQLQTFPTTSDNHASNNQQPEEVKSAAGTVEQSTPQEETVSEDNMWNVDQKDADCVVQTSPPEDHPKNEASNDSSTQLKEPKPKHTATEKMESLQSIDFQPTSIPTPTLPSDSAELSQEVLSADADTEEAVSGEAPAAVTQSVTGETLKPSSDSSPSGLPPPVVEGEGVHPESGHCPPEEQSQYPKSLWDAVSRIRKHTAPDSENEEEEVSEPWEPESAGQDATFSLPELDLHFQWTGVAGEQEGWTQAEDADSEEVEPPSGQILEHGAEDNVSCSSSSHDSEDTVVTAAGEEEELVDTLPDCASTTRAHEEDTEEDQCCLREVEEENAADTER